VLPRSVASASSWFFNVFVFIRVYSWLRCESGAKSPHCNALRAKLIRRSPTSDLIRIIRQSVVE